MDFHFDPTVSKHTSLVVTTFEVAGTLLIALLLRLLTRGVPGRFLFYWSRGWVALAAGIICLTLSFRVAPLLPSEIEPWLRRPAIAAYAVFHGTHTGPGGPVPPTGRSTSTDYVYVMQFEGDRIVHLTKIWHAGLALKELGWA